MLRHRFVLLLFLDLCLWEDNFCLEGLGVWVSIFVRCVCASDSCVFVSHRFSKCSIVLSEIPTIVSLLNRSSMSNKGTGRTNFENWEQKKLDSSSNKSIPRLSNDNRLGFFVCFPYLSIHFSISLYLSSPPTLFVRCFLGLVDFLSLIPREQMMELLAQLPHFRSNIYFYNSHPFPESTIPRVGFAKLTVLLLTLLFIEWISYFI